MMLRRARSTRGFAAIDNSVFADERLHADQLGLICYLISLPPNWELRTPHLRKRLGVGRDKLQRLMRELVAAGYLRVERLRDPETGAMMGSRVMVYDSADAPSQPGASPDDTPLGDSDDESCAAAGDDAQDDGSEGDETACAVAVAAQDSSPDCDKRSDAPLEKAVAAQGDGCGRPGPDFPAAGLPGAGFSGPGKNKKDINNIPPLKSPPPFGRSDPHDPPPSAPQSEPPASPDPPASARGDPNWPADISDAFGRLVDFWPIDEEVGGVSRIWAAFERLSDAERLHAIQRASAFRSDRRRRAMRIGSLRSYLADRKFLVAVPEPGAPLPNRVFVLRGTDGWRAWEARKGKRLPVIMRRGEDGQMREGWWLPSLFPGCDEAGEG